jgi:PHD/YefM family antitoxin component YafN of YafNO toxin-antitoxin module
MANITVSSGDFLKAYGRISEGALREPVSITSHDRERLVLLSADEYRRLKRNDRAALYARELADDDLRSLAASDAPPEAAAFDHEVAPK